MRKKGLIAACFLVAAVVYYVVYHSTKDYHRVEGELTRTKIIEIASSHLASLLEEASYLPEEYRDIRNYRFSIDRRNRVWIENFAMDFPMLEGRNYQAVKFIRKSSAPRIGPGARWICLDKNTGEVLVFSPL